MRHIPQPKQKHRPDCCWDGVLNVKSNPGAGSAHNLFVAFTGFFNGLVGAVQ
ncbi:MAG: hypothetical protein ACI92Z_002560, partial [Paracoccaceae bacterium]